MVFSNSLVAPVPLLLYETLLSRTELSPEEKLRYEQLHKGFIGEKTLERTLTSLTLKNIVHLFDSLFEITETEFQIDCILLSSDTIFLLEVKNYTGDYYIENDKIFNVRTRTQIYNPLNQLERSEFLFKRLLNEMRVDMQVRSYIVFINRDFMLYGASVQLPMIFPSQVERFLRKIDANAKPLTRNVLQLQRKLTEWRKERSAYERLPEYDISQLKRGLFCKKCSGELDRNGKQLLICTNCKQNYHLEEAALYAIAQYHLLFPKRKITPKNIIDWCGGSLSNNFIRKILNNNLNILEKGGHTHYVFRKSLTHIDILYKCLQENLILNIQT